jgi:general secretion pathway protein C
MILSRDGLLVRFSAVQWGALSRRLVPWCNFLLVLLLAYALAGISWRLWPQSAQGAGTPLLGATATASPSNTHSAPSLLAVAALHLFGEADSAAVTPPPSVIDAPETRLSLTLRGIVAVSAAGQGHALIAEGSRDELVYKVGDALPGGAVLHEVLADKVILKRGERFETLTLPRERVNFEDNASGGAAAAGRSATATGAPASGAADGGISQQLRTLRETVVNDPQQALSLVQVQPVMEGGVVKGYRVNPGKERKLFQGVGLRAGDVVTSVNGVALSDTAQLASLYSQFQSLNRFDLVVERGGRPTSLTIDLGK